MESDKADLAKLVGELESEITAAVDRVGALESWVRERFDGSTNDVVLHQACTQAAGRFLSSDPPQTGWRERLLVTLALHSSGSRRHKGLGACESVIRHLSDLLGDGRLEQFTEPKLMTLASGLTVALAIEDGITQEVEEAMRQLCDRHPDLLPEMASQCQDIWKRRGQMSGRYGLFVWDVRRQEWRLAQDFKPYHAPK